MDHLSEQPGFTEQQTKQWSDAINLKRKPLQDDSYTYLRKYSKTWPILQDILEGANLHADILAYFEGIFDQEASTDTLKEQLDDNKVLVENANVETANFALLFEFDGDIKKIRHVLYKCAASRPSIESQTNEDEIEVQTETLSLKATPLANGFVKAKTGDDTTDAVYQDWYKAVYMTSTTTNTESGVES